MYYFSKRVPCDVRSYVGILFEYTDEKAFVACQTLLDKYHAPQVKTFVNKVVGSRGIVLHEFTSEDFNWTF